MNLNPNVFFIETLARASLKHVSLAPGGIETKRVGERTVVPMYQVYGTDVPKVPPFRGTESNTRYTDYPGLGNWSVFHPYNAV